jgi:hypothetical protein
VVDFFTILRQGYGWRGTKAVWEFRLQIPNARFPKKSQIANQQKKRRWMLRLFLAFAVSSIARRATEETLAFVIFSRNYGGMPLRIA